MSEKTEIIDNHLNDDGFGFLIRWRYEPHWCDYEIFQVAGTDMNGNKPMYLIKDWSNSTEMTENLDEAEAYMSGFIKWDGCSEHDFNEHLFGYSAMKDHIEIVGKLYPRAAFLMETDLDLMD